MAKNYTFTEAVEIINEGTDMEAITDIGRRYPILLNKVTRVAAKAGEDFVDLMRYLPDHLTANKVNTAIKNSSNVEIEEAETDEAEEKDSDANDAKNTKSSDTSYDSMSGKELWEILGKAGKRKDCKEKMGGTKKDDMIAYINKYGLSDDTEAVEETDSEDESKGPYDGVSAPELFKECKKRGIKAAPKKAAKYYVDLLVKSDEEMSSKSDEVEDDDDWGDDEVEETKAAKAEKKESKKNSKKAAKEETTDDDDDWDI